MKIKKYITIDFNKFIVYPFILFFEKNIIGSFKLSVLSIFGYNKILFNIDDFFPGFGSNKYCFWKKTFTEVCDITNISSRICQLLLIILFYCIMPCTWYTMLVGCHYIHIVGAYHMPTNERWILYYNNPSQNMHVSEVAYCTWTYAY